MFTVSFIITKNCTFDFYFWYQKTKSWCQYVSKSWHLWSRKLAVSFYYCRLSRFCALTLSRFGVLAMSRKSDIEKVVTHFALVLKTLPHWTIRVRVEISVVKKMAIWYQKTKSRCQYVSKSWHLWSRKLAVTFYYCWLSRFSALILSRFGVLTLSRKSDIAKVVTHFALYLKTLPHRPIRVRVEICVLKKMDFCWSSV